MGVKKRFKNRESGIELLRIIAMLLIVLHHEVMHNALPVLDQELSVRKLTLQLFYFTPGKVGIALFFIISAWFVVDKTPSLRLSCRKVWILERELLFWSLCLGAVTLYKVPEERTIESLWKILFPLSRNTWWYATSYAIFLFLSPFLVRGLRALGKKYHGQCCLAMGFLWGVLTLIPNSNLEISLNSMGFIYVFVLIAYYKWNMRPFQTATAWEMFLISIIVILLWNVIVSFATVGHSDRIYEYLLCLEREWSVLSLALSFGLFLLFCRLHFQSRIVNSCAASTFGIYLITEHYYVRGILWQQWFNLSNWYDTYSAPVILLIVFVIGIAVFVVTLILDKVRALLFKLTIDRNKGHWFDVLWDVAERRFPILKDKN